MTDSNSASRQPSLFVLAIVSALLLLPYFAILTVDAPLVDPDEGLHAAIAQEMLDHHDWITPKFLGRPFFDKPILYFWALLLSLKTFGSTACAIRLPGLAFGLFGILATGYVGSRWFNRRTGWFAAAIQATCFLPWTASQIAVHDIALVPWTILGLFSLWQMDEPLSPRSRCNWHLAAGLFLGLAILTKGLLGVAFVLLAWIPAAWGTKRRSISGIISALILPLALAALVAAPWYLAMEFRNPGYAYYYFVKRHLMGFVSDSQPHGLKPFWYYLPILTAGTLPWWPYLLTPALVTPLFRKQKESTPQDHLRILLLCWFVLGLAFLFAAKSKLPSYLLPLFPAFSLMVGDLWSRFVNRELSLSSEKVFRITGALLLTLLPLAVLATLIALPLVCKIPLSWSLLPIAIVLASVAIFAPFFLFRDRRWPAFLFGTGTISLLGTVSILLFLPQLSQEHSGRPLADYLNANYSSVPPTIFLRERIGSIVFYLRPELRQSLHADTFETWTIAQFISRFHAEDNRLIVIPQREVPLILRYIEFTHAKFNLHDRYRLYESNAFVPLHVRRSQLSALPLAN